MSGLPSITGRSASLLALLFLSAAVYFAILHSQEALDKQGPREVVGEPVSKPHSTVNEGTELAQRPPSAESAELVPRAADVSRITPSISRLLSIANSPNPYPEVVELHGRGLPGDYAVVWKVVRDCSYALWLSHKAKSQGLLTGNFSLIPLNAGTAGSADYVASPDVHAQRIRAQQDIEARCAPIQQDDNLHRPHARDLHGLALRQAAGKTGNPAQDAVHELAELEAQQSPITRHTPQAVLLAKFPKEFSADLDPLQLEGLQHLAMYASQFDSTFPGRSLQALAACAGYGQCGKKPEELDLTGYGLPPGSPQHAKALELLPRVRALFRI